MQRSAFKVALDLWLVLVLITRATEVSSEDSCILNFTQQPVSSIQCDVYDSSMEIVLTCSVVSLSTADIVDPQDVSFRWYFYNGTEYELSMGINHTRSGGNGGNIQVSSTLQIGETSRNVAYLSQGFYYCQVRMIEIPSTSNFSQRFQVFSEDYYLQHAISCSGKTFIDSMQTCAVYRVNEELTTKTETMDMTTPQTPDREATTVTPPVDRPSSSPTSSTVDQTASSGETLQVWIYVLVAVAAVFAMIIIILAIMCVGLCLRRSQTMDTNSLDKKENGGIHGNFISHSNSMVNNELYHGGNRGEETDFTTGTHFTSLSQISDDNYNPLGERDYDVIVSRPRENNNSSSKQEYHHLQRPSLPAVPTGRNGTFGFSSPSGEFHSMNTLTSQMKGTDTFHNEELHLNKLGYSTLPARPPPPAYNGDMHIYRELEKPATTLPAGRILNGGIYHSPTDSSPPDSARYFERGDSTTALLPPLPPARGTGLRKGSSASMDSSLNESLYNPVSGATLQHPHPLQKIPETGTIFPDPPNPTAFPVNEYEYIPAMTEYEKPVASKQPRKVGENPKTRVSTKSMNYETDPNLEIRASDVADCTADSADATGDSTIMGFKLPLDDNSNANSTSVTETSDLHFSIGLKQDSTTVSQECVSTGNFTGGSSTGGYMSSVLSTDYIGASTDSLPSVNSNTAADFVESKENLRLNGMCYLDNRQTESLERCSMSRERCSVSREAPPTSSHTSVAEKDSENTQCIPNVDAVPLHTMSGNTSNKAHTPSTALSSSALPQTRPNRYQELDASSFKQHSREHAKLQDETRTIV